MNLSAPFASASRSGSSRPHAVGAWAGAGRLSLIIAAHAGLLVIFASGAKPSAPISAMSAAPVMVSFVAPAPKPDPDQPPQPVAEPAPPKPQQAKPAPRPTPKAKPEPKPRPQKPPVRQRPEPAETPPVAAQHSPPVTSPAPAPANAQASAPPAQAQPAMAAPPAPLPPITPVTPTITSGVQYLQAPAPEYPSIARRMGEEGTAVLRVLVNERGRPERAEVQTSSGSARLDEAARRAALRALFKPHVEDGRAVAVYAIIPIRFQLDS